MLDYNSSLSKEKLNFSDVDKVSDGCSIRILHYVRGFTRSLSTSCSAFQDNLHKLC